MAPLHDYVLRITLVLKDLETELSPSVYRVFSVSSAMPLDVLHDKILVPVMGWTRNYHTYLMQALNSHKAVYIQNDVNTMETFHVQGCYENVKPPEGVTIGDVLKQVGDRMLYVYDLGDFWRHTISLQEIREDYTGKFQLIDGAMRCPPEDEKGNENYQTTILDLYNSLQTKFSTKKAREFADACHQYCSALNVRAPFRPSQFDLSEREMAVHDALRSRNWARKSVKRSGTGLEYNIPNEQRFVYYQLEDSRLGEPAAYMNNTPFGFRIMGETVNLKPDEVSACYACGNPIGVKKCSRCHIAHYCSVACQKRSWDKHRKECKRFKREFDASQKNSDREVVNGGKLLLQRYDPDNLRFSVGDRVEAWFGPNQYGRGRIIKCMHREPSWPTDRPPAPYQIQMDAAAARLMGCPVEYALIYAVWDDDQQVRLLEEDELKQRPHRCHHHANRS